MTVNTALLWQTLEHIEANPETWDQSAYRCETGLCFAGWTVELAGCKWLGELDAGGWYADMLVPEPEDAARDFVFLADLTRGVSPASRARRLLGLTEAQAARLFASNNTMADLRRQVEELTAGVAA